MATLPTYQRRVLPSGGSFTPRINASDAVGAGIADVGRAIGNVGQQFGQLAAQENADIARGAEMARRAAEQQQAEVGRAWTAEALSSDHVKWADWLTTQQENAKPGAAGFAGEVLKAFDDATPTALESAPDDRTRTAYKERRLAMRTQLFEQARRFEATQGVKHRVGQWEASIDNVVQLAARDPEQARVAAEEVDTTLRDAPNQEFAAKLRETLKARTAAAATMGLVERNPALALSYLDQAFGVKRPETITRTGGAPAAADSLFEAVVYQESRGKHTDASGKLTTSTAGAQGITQLMPATAANPGYGIAPVKDQSEAEYKRVGREYLDAMVREFDGDQNKALAAYNAGPGAVQRAVARNGENWLAVMPDETRDYVAKINGRLSSGRSIQVASADPTQALAALPDGKLQASGSWFVDQLDPNTAATLRNRAQADLHRLEIQRKQDRDAADRAVGEQVKSYVGMMKDGFAPPADQMAMLQSVAKGTKWEPDLIQAQQTLTATSAFRVMPQDQRTALLDQMRARGNEKQWTPQEASLFETLTKLDENVRKAYEADPIRAGAQQGLYAAPSKVETANLQAVMQTLPERLKQTALVSDRMGVPQSPFTPEEANTVSGLLQQLAPRERSQAIGQLAAGMGPQTAQAFAKQIDAKDRSLALALAYSTAMTAPATNMWGTPVGEGRYVSELILKGAQAKQDGTSTKGTKTPETTATKWSARIAEELTGVFPGQQLTDRSREAAVLIAHGIASESSGQLSDADLKRAVMLAVGGSVIEHNGRRTVTPGVMSESDFSDRLGKIKPADIQTPDGQVLAAGVPMPVDEFVKTLPGQQLLFAGRGRYLVLVGGRPVTNTARQPIYVGVN